MSELENLLSQSEAEKESLRSQLAVASEERSSLCDLSSRLQREVQSRQEELKMAQDHSSLVVKYNDDLENRCQELDDMCSELRQSAKALQKELSDRNILKNDLNNEKRGYEEHDNVEGGGGSVE